MKRIIATVALTFGLAALAQPADAKPVSVIRLCPDQPYVDGSFTYCVWDASRAGHDWGSYKVSRDGTQVYVSNKRAKRLLRNDGWRLVGGSWTHA